MKLPRGVSGDELARLLGKYGYKTTRQTGSHMRLTSAAKDPGTMSPFPATTRLKSAP